MTECINVDQMYFIAGPTASGKSAAAIEIAQKVRGEIINADAMQIYADLDVLTARPSAEELAAAPHHLYGSLDGQERCSAGRWARMACQKIHEVIERDAVPIIVGGTGLYFKALLDGLSPVPEVPLEIREQGGALYDEIGGDAFREKILQIDPAMGWLPPSDRQRLIRAWEVFEYAGKTLSSFQALPRQPLVTGNITKYVISPPRDILYQKCDRRFDLMLELGALQEVEALLAKKLDPMLPVMKSLGVPELAQLLRHELSEEEAIELAKRNTRRFAKRQLTWFRGQAGDWPRVESGAEIQV